MAIAFGDLIGGVSGDMFVAALLDLGLPLARLKAELKKIPTLRFELKTTKKTVHSIKASQFRVLCAASEKPRSWKEIRELVQRSKLDAQVKATGIEVFANLARAEAKIHGVATDHVHFHEVGATDSIVDIMAAAIGLRELKIGALHFSPIPLGRGVTRSMHGPLPVPGPATLEILKGVPTYGVDIEAETVTPTGAAIVRTLGRTFGAQPAMTIEKIGCATGQKEFTARPNLFRLLLGSPARSAAHEEMLVIETNIDDMNPQLYDHVMERLFSAGARDVYLAPIQMKKNRPATLLSVICSPHALEALCRTLLQETTTIGVRYYPVQRMILARETKTVKTRFGNVRAKIVTQPDGSQRAAPEYDDLKKLAAATRIPIPKLAHEFLRSLKK